MATLTIRNLSDDLHEKLRVRAVEAGRSMQAEVRSLIAELKLDLDIRLIR